MGHVRGVVLAFVLVACERSEAVPASSEGAASSSGVTSAPAPRWPAVATIDWEQAARAIREAHVVAAIPTRDRRVQLTTETGSLVTTAPDDRALEVLLDEVDPDHSMIGTTSHHAGSVEIDWGLVQPILRGGKVLWIEDNDRGRLFVTLADDARSQYVTYAPPDTDVAALVESLGQRPLFIGHFPAREIRWKDALVLLRGKVLNVSSLHGKRVDLRDGSGRFRTYEPAQDATVKLLREIDPLGTVGLTVE